MMDLQTYAEHGIWRPGSLAEANTGKKMANGVPVTYIKLSCGAGAAVAVVYDSADGNALNTKPAKIFLDASQTVNDTQTFANPVNFRDGVYVVFEQGGDFSPVVSLGVIP